MVRKGDTMHTMNEPNLTGHSVALDQMVELLRPSEGFPWRYAAPGFVDVLGDSDPVTSRFMHQLVNSKVLPRIYERVWRPIAGRLLFGREMAGGREKRIILEMLGISAGERVLDVGCGPGNYTRDLAQQADDGLVVGIDASESMLEIAMKRGGGDNLAYVRGDACMLPFEDATFDVVCCVGVIHMIDNAMGALDEMIRVLAPGGRVVLAASFGDSSARSEMPGGVRVFGRDELTGALSERGLVDIGQRLSHHGQFVSGRKPEESVGR